MLCDKGMKKDSAQGGIIVQSRIKIGRNLVNFV